MLRYNKIWMKDVVTLLGNRSARKNYLDILRILASFLVCYNHAYGFHLYLDQEADGSLLSWLNVFLSVFTKINIPMFFMISGALLLGREESYKTVFRKRIWRVMVLIGAVSILTYIGIPRENPSVEDFVYALFRGNVNHSHWYLFAYLSFLLLLPLMRKLCGQITKTDVAVMIFLHVLLKAGVPILNYWIVHWGYAPVVLSESLQLPVVLADCFFCPMMGYYFDCRVCVRDWDRKNIFAWLLVLAGGMSLASWMTYSEGMHIGFSQNYITLFSETSAISVFLLTRYLLEGKKIPERLEKLFARISSAAVGIYLLEPIVVYYLYIPFFHNVPWNPVVITACSVLWALVCMGVGGGITDLLRKIPGVKDYL